MKQFYNIYDRVKRFISPRLEFIFTFTTGRSGTGFLSQAFGHQKFSKSVLHQIDNALVTHESWRGVPIEELKKLPLASECAAQLCQKVMDKKSAEIREAYPEVSQFLIADHKIGRFLTPSLASTSYPYKVIRIHREEGKVLASFMRIYNERKRDTDEATFERFYKNNWSRNYFAPSDTSALLKIKDDEWARYSPESKFSWYIEEVNRQWSKAKERLPSDRYIEISFDQLITEEGLQLIESFIGIPYSRIWWSERANHKVQTKYA